MPKRIQRRRTKGWKMPPNTVYVGRPTGFGNPWKVGQTVGPDAYPMSAHEAVDNYRKWMIANQSCPERYRIPVAQLRGKDLACWCPLCEKHKNGRPMNEPCSDCPPCHADILLAISNPGGK